METPNIEKNLNIEVHEYMLQNYPMGPHAIYPTPYLNFEVKTISAETTEDEDCGKFKTEFDKDIPAEIQSHPNMGMLMNKADHEYSLNTRVCDPINGKLLITKELKPIEEIPFVNISTNPKAYSRLNFNLDGIELVDIMKFIAKFGSKRNNAIKKEELINLGTMSKIYDKTVILNEINSTKEILSNFWIDNIYPSFKVDDNSAKDITLIKLIRKDKNEKYIIFGDFHGSFSTLVRHFLRFRRLGIMNENCIIQKGFNLIFLGDFVDRGRLGYENAIFLILLQKLNPERVYMNRGNHEEISTNSNDSTFPLKYEMNRKFDDNDVHTNLNNLFNYFSSAIILEKPKDIETDPTKYIYMAHGGYPIVKVLGDKYTLHARLSNLSISKNNILIKNTDLENPLNGANSVRWSDFSINPITVPHESRGFLIGKDLIDEAVSYNIIMTIRGHEDMCFNTKFIVPYPHQKSSCGKFSDINTLNPNNLFMKGSYDYSNKPSVNCYRYSHIIKLDTKSTLTPTFNINGINRTGILPVLTISNNMDIGRDLFKDSFILLRFDEGRNNYCFVENSQQEIVYRTNILKEKISNLLVNTKDVTDEAYSKLKQYIDKHNKLAEGIDIIHKINPSSKEIMDNKIVELETILSKINKDTNLNHLQFINAQLGFFKLVRERIYGKHKLIGGEYYSKYLKYKAKYLKLKKNFN